MKEVLKVVLATEESEVFLDICKTKQGIYIVSTPKLGKEAREFHSVIEAFDYFSYAVKQYLFDGWVLD